jgi:NAD(P)-dependent dehydrogenase (short-subunit alcohol dehydrogenase family)
MEAKHLLITGSTDGIGKLAAIQLAKQHHHIYLHGRNPNKLKNTIAEVKEASQNSDVTGFVADFANLNSVRQMAQEIQSEVPQLDVLINNAGIFQTSNPITESGIDVRLVVNYLAPYLLTKEVLPLLEKGTQSRIVNLSSAAQSPVFLEALEGKTHLNSQQAYAQSKLALTMWSFDLANTLSDISVIAVNPGSLLNTKMVQEAYGQHWSSADKGSSLLADLATASEFEGITGKYFDNDLGDPRGRFGKAYPDAYNQEKINQLIEFTENLLTRL